MTSREMEKMQTQKAKRRLQAITFLTNISLDGSYKDTGWGLEHAKIEAAVACDHNHQYCRDDYKDNFNYDPDNETDGAGGVQQLQTMGQGQGQKVNNVDYSSTVLTNVHLNHAPGHSRGSSADARIGLNKTVFDAGADSVVDSASGSSGRKRANTTQISDAGRGGRRASSFNHQDSENVPPVLSHQKHAHFSSNESMEQSIFSKSCKISNTNISEGSGTIPHPRQVKVFNLRENPPPVIKNERLILMVNKRSSVTMFSTIPYSSTNKYYRPATSRTAAERAEALKRTRNASGSRPMSAMSDPDPLEQLVHVGDEEVSYGYLMKPSNVNFKSTNISSTNGPKSRPKHMDIHGGFHKLIHLDNAKHPCISYESTFKPKKQLIPHQMQSSSSENTENHPVDSSSSNKAQSRNSATSPAPVVTFVGGSPHNSYHPQLLDDPELRAGKHRTLLTFPSYMTSVIDYCKPSDLKKELNDKFRERFPHVQLTLSKLRSLKREMRKVAKTECNIDLLTVAQAYVYFEKLILLSFVTKFNRKYCAGACLLLSAKLNDVKGDNLHNLIEKIEAGFRVNRRDLISYEFAALVALEFALHLPTSEVSPHYQRLLYES